MRPDAPGCPPSERYRPLVEGQAVDGLPQVFRQQRAPTILLNSPHAPARLRAAEGQASFGHVGRSLVIKGQAGRKRKSLRHQFEMTILFFRHLYSFYNQAMI